MVLKDDIVAYIKHPVYKHSRKGGLKSAQPVAGQFPHAHRPEQAVQQSGIRIVNAAPQSGECNAGDDLGEKIYRAEKLPASGFSRKDDTQAS